MSQSQFKCRIDDSLKSAVRAYADAHNTSMSAVAEAALREYLNPEDYKAVSLGYLSKVENSQRLLLKRLDAVLETLGKFALIYLLHTPERPDEDELRAAQNASARRRYNQFLDSVAQSLGTAKSYQSFLEKTIAKASDFPTWGDS